MPVTIRFVLNDGRRSVASDDIISFDLERTDGDPCCALVARLAYSDAADDAARTCSRVQVWADDRLRFTGVVDETVTTMGDGGRTLEVSCRSLAALMMERRCSGADFLRAAWADIYALCVAPCDIPLVDADDDLGTLERFSITSGTSAWRVLRDWAGAQAGISPHFDAEGRLILRKNAPRGTLTVGAGHAIPHAERRTLRRDVISTVTISERTSGRTHSVYSATLRERGFTGAAAIAAPSGALEARVPEAKWMLALAAREVDTITLTLAAPFAAEPGDRLALSLDGFPREADITAVRTLIDADGARSVITACVPQII